MIRKKIIALLLAATCILGTTSVYADTTTVSQDSSSQSASISVNINKPETWEVLVPKSITPVVTGDSASSDTKSIIVSGDLYGGRTLTLDVPTTCTLNATKGTSNTLIANVNTVGNTPKTFSSDDLHNKSDNKYQFNVTASNIVAENWVGSMTVNISVVQTTPR